MAVQGRYAYVGVGPRLLVVDVGDPTRPVAVGRTGVLPGVVRGVAVSGAYAYVANWAGGLRVIDVSNPSSPREVGAYDTPGDALGVAVSGAYAYVAAGSLRVVDVSNPASPREVGAYDTPRWAYGVAVSGPYAYVAAGSLRVVDVSNPASPREVGYYDTPGFARGVAVSGAYAYVADEDGGLVILRFLGAGATPTPTPTVTRTPTPTPAPSPTPSPTPLPGLTDQVNRLTDQAIDGLSQLKDDADQLAALGDYFFWAIYEDGARMVLDLVFGLLDVFYGASQSESLKAAARVACPGCYIPGTWNVRFGEKYPLLKRLLDIGLYPIEKAPADLIADRLKWGAVRFIAMTSEPFIGKGARELETRLAIALLRQLVPQPNGLSTYVGPSINQSADQARAALDDERRRVLANLPALTAAEQDAYRQDLALRQHAINLGLKRRLESARLTLQNLKDARESAQQFNLYKFMLRAGLNGLAGILADGPGVIAVAAAQTTISVYLDRHQLGLDQLAYQMAFSGLLGAPEGIRQILMTAESGLLQVARAQPPNPARGEVGAIRHVVETYGCLFGRFWCSNRAYTEVTLTNTGASRTSYVVVASYLADVNRLGLPWTQLFLDALAGITLEPGQTATVRVDYLFDTGSGPRGFIPRSGSTVGLTVLGTNDSGTFLVKYVASPWAPQRVSAGGLSAQQEAEVIDPPLTAYVLGSGPEQRHQAMLFVHNPLTSSVAVTVTQPLTVGVEVLDPGAGQLTGGGLRWQGTVGPGATQPFTFTFRFGAVPGTAGALPPASLSLTELTTGLQATEPGNPVGFRALWPVGVVRETPSFVLPGVSAGGVVTVTNWAARPVSGTVEVELLDEAGASRWRGSLGFDLDAGASQGLRFSLPGDLPKGFYAVQGRLTAAGATAVVFRDLLQVGLPGPWLLYTSMPEGPLKPGDVVSYSLRFTNTTGVDLSGVVVTATVPGGSVVVPGSVTGGGSVVGDQVRWAPGVIGAGQNVALEFRVQVRPEALRLGRVIASRARLTADQVLPVESPEAWNLLQAYRLYLPLVARGGP